MPGKLGVDIQQRDLSRPGRPWRIAIAIGVFTAFAYFLAARLSLVLLTELEGVAVFWPASGVAVGILMALGPGARAPVATGVIVATIAANLLGDRNLWASLFSGLCNAGGATLTAWLIGRWFGQPFRLDTLSRVLGFLLAATIGAAATAVGGAITMRLFHTTAPVLSIWQRLVYIGWARRHHDRAAVDRAGPDRARTATAARADRRRGGAHRLGRSKRSDFSLATGLVGNGAAGSVAVSATALARGPLSAGIPGRGGVHGCLCHRLGDELRLRLFRRSARPDRGPHAGCANQHVGCHPVLARPGGAVCTDAAA